MRNDRIAAIARLQDGLVTRAQALCAGVTPAALRHALRPGGPWQRVSPGLYVTFTGPLGRIHRLRAAVLHAGEGSMITGSAACEMAGLRYLPASDGVVHVLVDMARQPASTDHVQVCRTSRLPTPLRWLDEQAVGDPGAVPPWWEEADVLAPTARPGEIQMAPVARAVLDTVRLSLSPTARDRGIRERLLRDTRALMCEAVQRRRCSVDDIVRELNAAPRAGTSLARQAVDDIVQGCRSAPECELRDVVRSSRTLPEPRWNRPLPGYGEVWPDACWKEARMVCEVDGKAWHGFGDAPEKTEERRAIYAQLGWIVVPVSPMRLRRDPAAVRRQLEAAYRAGLARRGAI